MVPRIPEGPEVLEKGTEPVSEPSLADHLHRMIKTYYNDPKVSWEKYPRVADYIVDLFL